MYCSALRARFNPYFLRSLTRESRTNKPARFSGDLSAGLASCKALAIPCLIAPALPTGPPPDTLAETLYFPSVCVTRKGSFTCCCQDSQGSDSSIGLSLTTMGPSPAYRRTLATAVLRLPFT